MGRLPFRVFGPVYPGISIHTLDVLASENLFQIPSRRAPCPCVGGSGAVHWRFLSENIGKKGFSGGKYIVSVGLILFAFATITSWYYYGEKCICYLFPRSKKIIPIYKTLYIGAVFLGSILNLNTVWAFCDLFNGLMAIPNLIALILLSPEIRQKTREFFKEYLSEASS